jgi:hypothetical protein
MAKPVISPEEFIAEMNKRIKEHGAYEDGMRVFLVPEGATGRTASGYGFDGPGRVQMVVGTVHDHVEALYVTDPYISRPA